MNGLMRDFRKTLTDKAYLKNMSDGELIRICGLDTVWDSLTEEEKDEALLRIIRGEA